MAGPDLSPELEAVVMTEEFWDNRKAVKSVAVNSGGTSAVSGGTVGKVDDPVTQGLESGTLGGGGDLKDVTGQYEYLRPQDWPDNMELDFGNNVYGICKNFPNLKLNETSLPSTIISVPNLDKVLLEGGSVTMKGIKYAMPWYGQFINDSFAFVQYGDNDGRQPTDLVLQAAYGTTYNVDASIQVWVTYAKVVPTT